MARWLGLAWLGRHGSAVIAVGVFLGLAIPPLASLLKPLLIPAIVGPFLIALIRLDWTRLGDYLTRPAPTALALLWLLVLSPLLVHAVVRLLGLPAPIDGGLALMAAAPPLIRRFGRFPHRNAILGRPDTRAEAEYLSEVEERYGQEAPVAADR